MAASAGLHACEVPTGYLGISTETELLQLQVDGGELKDLQLYFCNDIEVSADWPFQIARDLIIEGNQKSLIVHGMRARPLFWEIHNSLIQNLRLKYTSGISMTCSSLSECRSYTPIISLSVPYGLLAGHLFASRLSNILASGQIIQRALISNASVAGVKFYFGGLVGLSYNSVLEKISSHVSIQVEHQRPRTGNVWGIFVGGVAGYVYNQTENIPLNEVTSHNNIDVSIKGSLDTTYVGGLSSFIFNSSSDAIQVLNSYSDGRMTIVRERAPNSLPPQIQGKIAGLTVRGDKVGAIQNSYSRRQIEVFNREGGLLSPVASSAYAIARPFPENFEYNSNPQNTIHSYASSSTQLQKGVVMGFASQNRTDEDLRLPSTFENWDFEQTWNIPTAQFPKLNFENIWQRHLCPMDFNQDNQISVPDIFSYLHLWFLLDSAADFNQDAVIDSVDLFGFLSEFFGLNGQPCPEP